MVFPAWEIFKQDRLSVQAVCQINAYLPSVGDRLNTAARNVFLDSDSSPVEFCKCEAAERLVVAAFLIPQDTDGHGFP